MGSFIISMLVYYWGKWVKGEIRWVRYVAYKGQTRNAYKVLFEQSDMNRPVRRLGVDRRYWNTSSTDACEVVDWQGAGTSGRTLWIQGPVLQDLGNTGISGRTLCIQGPVPAPCEHSDQCCRTLWIQRPVAGRTLGIQGPGLQDLANTGINGKILWIQGPVAGHCEQRGQWQDLVNTGTSGRTLKGKTWNWNLQ